MRPDTIILSLTAAALDTTATVLRTVSTVVTRIASGLSPAEPDGEREQRPPAPVRAAPAVDASEPRPASVDVAQLVKGTAPQVIAALDDLSDMELGELYEREANGRRRSSVLQAIEAASAPPAGTDEAAPPVPDADVREDDVLVYTSETPA